MDGISNHNINDAHKINRVVRSQPPQPLKEQLNRDHNSRSFGQSKEKQSEGESVLPTQAGSDQKENPIKETVTISLERYEALKQSQEKQERIEQLIREMCDYRLVSVKGDHAAYQLLVNSQAFMEFIQKEILEQETIQITDIQWNQPKEN